MAKLSKAQAKAHQQACDLLAKDVLTEDDKYFVLENWQESAKHINTIAGAFFTPVELARSFSIEVCGNRVIDLCAGIGGLSFAYRQKCLWGSVRPEIICIEQNPDYVAVGRKILPEATWIVGDVFSLPAGLGRFDCAISNPPFGATPRNAGQGPRYRGREFEYHVIDIASDLADWGVFIIPQTSAPFEYSGKPNYRERIGDQHRKLQEMTGIVLLPNCGIDTSACDGQWHGVSVRTEIVIADFEEARATRAPVQAEMFGEAA
jgi:hypothetical protein